MNSTVAQLAKAVNHVLSKTYNYLYQDDDGENEEPAQLKLLTAPLAASEEIEKLFTAGIIDIDSALPAALHALGATTDEVENALARSKEKQDKQTSSEDEDRKRAQQDQDLNFREREAGVKKTEADTKKAEHEAAAPFTTGAGASSGSGSNK